MPAHMSRHFHYKNGKVKNFSCKV
jgi:hypothetical protein